MDLLEGLAHQPVLSHPKQTKAIAAARFKHDRVDAERLVLLLRGDLLSPPRAVPFQSALRPERAEQPAHRPPPPTEQGGQPGKSTYEGEPVPAIEESALDHNVSRAQYSRSSPQSPPLGRGPLDPEEQVVVIAVPPAPAEHRADVPVDGFHPKGTFSWQEARIPSRWRVRSFPSFRKAGSRCQRRARSQLSRKRRAAPSEV